MAPRDSVASDRLTRSEIVNPMKSTTARTPLILAAIVIGARRGGTPESGRTTKFMNRYTKPP